MADIHEFEKLCGAVLDPEVTRAFRAIQPVRSYSALPRESGQGKQRFLWSAERKVLGKDFEELQDIGDCVSKSVQRAIIQIWCVRMVLGGENEIFPGTPASETIYGLARHEIGRDRLGFDNGSGRNGGAIMEYGLVGVQQYGILLRQAYLSGKYDFSKYSGQLALQYGNKGLPDDLEPIARRSPLKVFVPIRTTAEMRDAIYNLESVLGGSNHIPSNGAVRDGRGFIPLGGRGGHATMFSGFDDTTSAGLMFFYNNASWPAVKGPQPFDCPRCGGWVSAKTVQAMIDEGSWFAVSDLWTIPNQVATAADFDIFG